MRCEGVFCFSRPLAVTARWKRRVPRHKSATAFGVRGPGTALVVNFDSTAMIEDRPTASLVPEICRIQDDYQSGSKPPRSKGAPCSPWLIQRAKSKSD